MDFEIPADIRSKLAELDEFIETQIRPLEQEDDNIRLRTVSTVTETSSRKSSPSPRRSRSYQE